jgi:proliferating cell nuclear antigen
MSKNNRELEIITEHTVPIKILVEVLKELIPDAILEIIKTPTEKPKKNKDGELIPKKDKNGIRIVAIDTTQTVLINLKLDANKFTSFECKKQKTILGVNLTYLHKLIKSVDRDDVLTFYQDKLDNDELSIEVENKDSGKLTNDNLKLMDYKKEKLSIPNVEYEAYITMNSVEFHKLCREMSQLAEYVDIRCLKNKIEFACKGDYANRKIVFRTDNPSKDNVTVEYPAQNANKPLIVQGIYELKNLVAFGKCGQLCDKIEIFMKNDFPLVIKYQVASLGRLYLCLSPVSS